MSELGNSWKITVRSLATTILVYLVVLTGNALAADSAWRHAKDVDDFTDAVFFLASAVVHDGNRRRVLSFACKVDHYLGLSFDLGEPIAPEKIFVFVGVADYAKLEVRVDTNPTKTFLIPMKSSERQLAPLMIALNDLEKVKGGEPAGHFEFDVENAKSLIELIPEMQAGTTLRWRINSAVSGQVSGQFSLIGFTAASKDFVANCR